MNFNFASVLNLNLQAPLVKLQIVTLAAKLFIMSPTDRTLGLLSRYIFSLARYDMNYDVRDRARMVTSLLVGVAPNSLVNGDEQPEERSGVVLRREQIRLVLFEGKSGVVNDEPSHLGAHLFYLLKIKMLRRGTDDENVMIGTVSSVICKLMQMDDVLLDWLENGTVIWQEAADEGCADTTCRSYTEWRVVTQEWWGMERFGFILCGYGRGK